MFDRMEPLTQFSPLGGELSKVTVRGEGGVKPEYENDLESGSGKDRSMFCYAPSSGCPDSKQTQVLFVLRDENTRSSAEEVMRRLGLDELAEKEHFLLLFPNPEKDGWNTRTDPDYLVRCFTQLRESSLQVGGFNGMLYYLAVSPKASSFLADLIALHPGTVAGAVLGDLPENYTLPKGALGVEAAAWCQPGVMAGYLKKANAVQKEEVTDAGILYTGRNPSVKLLVSEEKLDKALFQRIWKELLWGSRRWQNDTYGSYHPRTEFTARGFTAHVQETCLNLKDGIGRTWYEYIPPNLRGTNEKMPLVFYFHGVNCVPLYGAEQSCWHDVADQEGFMVVYPAPSRGKYWNIYDLPTLPGDMDYILALLEHLKSTYPIDEKRVYLSGFSMGGMMTHALSAAYPELFAGAAPCNAFAFNRFTDPGESLAPFLPDVDPETLGHESFSAQLADEKKKARPSLQMPVIQNAGLIDGLIASWPVKPESNDTRTKTLCWWMEYNGIDTSLKLNPDLPSGLDSSEWGYADPKNRCFYQYWKSSNEQGLPLLALMLSGRMAHALDPVQIHWAWQYLRRFSREADGSLTMNPERK